MYFWKSSAIWLLKLFWENDMKIDRALDDGKVSLNISWVSYS